MHMVVFISYQ